MNFKREFIGELIGTFILVFFGCGSVAVTVLFSAHVGLLQVAAIWGLGVTLAIYATRHLSGSHLNPAVSLAMVIGGRMSFRKLPVYISAQFLGAFIAAGVVYLLFDSSIAQYEATKGIIRSTPESYKTAMIFGEFYPNPGVKTIASVSTINAILAEAAGTFALVFLIFSFTAGCNVGGPDKSLSPVFIGLTVTIIISIIAPLTQAGLNPARDFAPRLFSYFAGWKTAAFPDNHYGFFTVYILGPFLGGSFASIAFIKIIEPLMTDKADSHYECEK